MIERALERNPSDRYQSMRDLVIDLRRVSRLVDRPLDASAGRRHLWQWAAVTAALVLVAAAVVVSILRSSARTEPRAEFTQLTNFSDSVVAPALSPDGRMLAFIRGEDTFQGAGDVYVSCCPMASPSHSHTTRP